ncbi:hypothetical protein [Methylobacter sp.]|uniref:hypothetical protein n=1 Tax=Methylobacter sp. TaxID=2051955 RepID=UPI00120C345D|nr:hypothetical protein [Methylobacter sp.]TAK59482.1 MAG: hypothetical protein EPO18_20175 [Methylobacter sp.]
MKIETDYGQLDVIVDVGMTDAKRAILSKKSYTLVVSPAMYSLLDDETTLDAAVKSLRFVDADEVTEKALKELQATTPAGLAQAISRIIL